MMIKLSKLVILHRLMRRNRQKLDFRRSSNSIKKRRTLIMAEKPTSNEEPTTGALFKVEVSTNSDSQTDHRPDHQGEH